MKQNEELISTPDHRNGSSQPLVDVSIHEKEFNLINYEGLALARNVLFACEDCAGPLVPASQCIVCKKTSSRWCVNCSSKVRLDIHKSCECLALLGSLHANRKKSKIEVKP